MNRRLVIKNIVVFTGGVFLLPACTTHTKPTSVLLENIKINADQELLLEELSETLIPESETPGAKTLGLHLFILKMVDDCYNERQRKGFTKGLVNFDKHIKDEYGKTFNECGKSKKEQIITQLESKSLNKTISEFYSITKKELIKGYKNSEYFMTNVQIYELVPGRYNGFFRVNQGKK